MDRDFVIGIVLLLVIFFVWQSFGPKPQPALVPEDSAVGESVPGSTIAPALVPDKATQTATPYQAPPGQDPTGMNPVGMGTPETTVSPVQINPQPAFEVDGENFVAKFSNVGGRISSWKLKNFNDVAGLEGKPLDMVSLPDSGKLPMSTYWVGAGPRINISDVYEIESKGPDRIVFTRTDSSGFKITKTFEPDLSGYGVKLNVFVQAPAGQTGQGRLSISNYREQIITKSGLFSRGFDITKYIAYVAGKKEEEPIEKAAGVSYPGNVIWAGFDNLYFLSVIAPIISETAQAQAIGSTGPGDPVASVITMPERMINSGETVEWEFTAYLGPKTEKTLIAAAHSFDQALDFGWFTIIAKPLVRVLQFFQGLVKNWGLAIIIVTIIIKLLLLPLTQKSYKSMSAMSKLQPAMKEIREKFGEDRERLNQEMMALYKAHGVSPAAGCLPMLVQLPFFIAFYRALYGTIELRHAPFMFWIQDLSAPDPYYVTPIVMGITMVASQKMTPTTADPMQAKMMLMMPVVFTFFFLNLPSGLVLYWLVSNVLTIGQQYYLRRSSDAGSPQEPDVPKDNVIEATAE
jgi:YidC/Oxa1 family membrane protein insertase